MVLVGAAVWIHWLRGDATPATTRVDALLDHCTACIAPVICRNCCRAHARPRRSESRRRFAVLPMRESADGATHIKAGALHARCRWALVAPLRPSICLIARLPVEYDLPLLQDDRHFDAIVGVEPPLRLVRE